MGKRQRGGHGGGGREDQFGDFGGGQDRDDRPSFSQKGGTGGGAGGSQTRHKAGHDLNFQRHVPKFLQQYAHMLGGKKGGGGGNEDGADEDAPVSVGGPQGKHRGQCSDSDEEEGGARRGDDVEADALRRAMEDNPELAAEFEGKLTQKLNQAQAVEEKEKGNRAFAARKYKAAVESFTRCIELDPQCEVYWSNRSAAHAALEEWEPAAVDAKQAVKLKPRWAKAHSRLAVAFYGLKLFSDAVESYKRALAIEPDDMALQQGLEKAEFQEQQQVEAKKHVFFNKKQKLGGQAPVRPAGGSRQPDTHPSSDAGLREGEERKGQREGGDEQATDQGKGASKDDNRTDKTKPDVGLPVKATREGAEQGQAVAPISRTGPAGTAKTEAAAGPQRKVTLSFVDDDDQ